MRKKSVFIISILLLILLSPILVSAQDEYGLGFYNDYIKPYVVSDTVEDVTNPVVALIIGIIALTIVIAIIWDITTLVSPLGDTVNKILALGIGIVMILLKTNVFLASWIILIGSAVFGWAGAFGMGLTIILAILALVFLVTGWGWISKFISHIQGNKMILKAKKEAYKKAAEDIKKDEYLEKVMNN